MEVDLFGQAYAEMGPAGLMSGPGGASDFARGVWAAGGLRIVALAASAAKGADQPHRGAGRGAGPVSLGRMDTDIVVTEYGAADLRGLGPSRTRARADRDRAAGASRAAATQHWAALAAEILSKQEETPWPNAKSSSVAP